MAAGKAPQAARCPEATAICQYPPAWRIVLGMTFDIFELSLRSFQRRSPFRPFTVELVSKHRFQVDHPEALILRGGTAVYVAANGAPTLFDHESVSQITAEPLAPSAS